MNYIEACYEKNHNLDPDAERYWKAIRKRAGVNENYQLTIDNTDLAKEVNIVMVQFMVTWLFIQVISR